MDKIPSPYLPNYYYYNVKGAFDWPYKNVWNKPEQLFD